MADKCSNKNIVRICSRYGKGSPLCKKILSECEKRKKKK